MVLTGSVDIKWIRERLQIKKEKGISSTILLGRLFKKKIKIYNIITVKEFFMKMCIVSY